MSDPSPESLEAAKALVQYCILRDVSIDDRRGTVIIEALATLLDETQEKLIEDATDYLFRYAHEIQFNPTGLPLSASHIRAACNMWRQHQGAAIRALEDE